jgi:GT2 family glycosyltransferase
VRASFDVDTDHGTDTPGARKHLCVVVINYRTPDLVADCLQSLVPELDATSDAVVVVDNHSDDGSVAEIEDWLVANDAKKLVRLIRAQRNLGFSGGNNLGMSACDADYYLLLNSDTIVRPGAIATLLRTAESFPGAGLISPRLEWPDGDGQQSCFRFPTPVSEFIDAARTGPITRALARFNVPMPLADTVVRPSWTSFACVLLRADMLRTTGPMDEGFFLYFEDVEFCWRARRAGWDVLHNPAARVVHLRGGSAPVKKLAAQRKALPRYYYESRARYFFIAHGRAGLTLSNCLWWLGRCVSKFREVLERRPSALPQRQASDIWTNWRHPQIPRSHP